MDGLSDWWLAWKLDMVDFLVEYPVMRYVFLALSGAACGVLAWTITLAIAKWILRHI